MSHAVVPFTFKGEQFYTHTSWFSENQYNAWSSIPAENKNLALYYGISTIGVVGIVNHHQCSFSERTPLSNLSSPATVNS